VKFEDTTFLFTDNQIVQEEFLEDINNILNSGKSMFGTSMILKLIIRLNIIYELYLFNILQYLFKGKYQIYLNMMTWRK